MYKKLKEIRYKNEYTAKQMSEMLKISKPFYCQLENCTRRLSYDMAIRIANIFNMMPDYIFYDDHIKEKKA